MKKIDSTKSTGSGTSNNTLSHKKIAEHTIPVRIDLIKNLMKNKKIDILVNFDNTNTDNFIGSKNGNNEEDESYSQNDIRSLLHKQNFNFAEVINELGGLLAYIKSGATGHTFKGTTTKMINGKKIEFNFGVKVVAYPKKIICRYKFSIKTGKCGISDDKTVKLFCVKEKNTTFNITDSNI